MYAILEGKQEIVRMIIEHSHASKRLLNSANYLCDTPFNIAIRYGQSDIVRLLLQHHIDFMPLDVCGLNCLSIAITNGHFDIADLLLEHPTLRDRLINQKQPSGSILLLAITKNGENIARRLLQLGADISRRNLYGQNCLMLAIQHKMLELTADILDLETSDALFDVADLNHRTILEYAVIADNAEILERVLLRSIISLDSFKRAIRLAESHQSWECLKKLLSQPLDAEKKTAAKTLLEASSRPGAQAIIQQYFSSEDYLSCKNSLTLSGAPETPLLTKPSRTYRG
jgi:ankyrin repeat protein